MKKNFIRLDCINRAEIASYLLEGYSIRSIATKLKVSANTIAREIKLGKTKASWMMQEGKNNRYPLIDYYYVYNPYKAEEKAKKRKKLSNQIRKLDKNKGLRNTVLEMLINQSYKPDVIAGRLKYLYPNEYIYHISHTAIYSWINLKRNKHLQKYLEKGRKKTHRYNTHPNKKNPIKDRVSIHNRPNTKGIFCNFEGDSIVSNMFSSGSAIHTEVEMKTKYIFAEKIQAKTADASIGAMIKIFEPIKHLVKTVTLDNGSEFHKHYILNKKLGINTYFADPYSSWQRGLNEKSNGLLRRFILKGSDLKNISQAELDEYVSFWNNMPRKCLGYKTPKECWDKEIAALK
jgi:IS30 family transposase